MLAPSSKKPGERIRGGFRSINAHAEQERFGVSRNPTTVTTANGEVQTNEEATENVHDLELFVTVQLLEDTPAVLSSGKLCEEHGYSYACGPVVRQNNFIQYGKLCADCCPRIGDRFVQLERKFVFHIVNAGDV